MKSFLTACGLADSLQLVIESDSLAKAELRLLHQPFALIGRDPRADVVLDHVQVSRRHVYLQVVERQAFWVDLESRTGTRSDGEIQKWSWLDESHPLGIGPFVIRRFVGHSRNITDNRHREPSRTLPLFAVADSQSSLPEVALEFLNGPSQSMAWPVRRMMSLIGSASGCKFRLTDASVSRFHASLLRTSVGLWIVDLLGQGGISVNEVPRRFSHLADGDRLRIGRYQIRIKYGAERPGSSNESPDRTRSKSVAPTRGRDRTSNGLMIPDRVAPAPAFPTEFGASNGMEFPVAIRAFSSLTQVGVPPAEAISPLKLAPGELTESMLVPLVNQFGLMQQQMFDQFQQAMAMMVQMFGTMHRDQMAVIREELDRLNELTAEFHALKAELTHRTKDQQGTVSSGPVVATRGVEGAVATEPSAAARAKTAASEPMCNSTAVDGNPGPLIQSPPSAAEAPAQQSSSAPGLSSRPPVSKPSAPRPAAVSPPEGLRSAAKTDNKSDPADSDRDSVVWLHQRIMILQNERETRWQKILKLLPGVS